MSADDLVSRLRGAVGVDITGEIWTESGDDIDDLMAEAADAIERLCEALQDAEYDPDAVEPLAYDAQVVMSDSLGISVGDVVSLDDGHHHGRYEVMQITPDELGWTYDFKATEG